jgi:hypothetical protein
MTMRVMVIVKANEDSEAGKMPTEAELTAMGAYNEELVAAGVMLDGDGLHPSDKGVRVSYSRDSEPSVTDGPFAETKELIAGFWVWQVRDMDEAIEWARRAPFGGAVGAEEAIEIRPIFEAEDFGEELTPELREREGKLRQKLEEQSS